MQSPNAAAVEVAVVVGAAVWVAALAVVPEWVVEELVAAAARAWAAASGSVVLPG